MDKKKIFTRPVVAAVVLGIAGVAGALGYALSEEQQQAVINVIMLIVGMFS